MLSIIINTCAGTKDEELLQRRGSRDNCGKKPYAKRAEGLREMLRRYAETDYEVIVVGEWEAGEGYNYIEDPGKLKDPSDQAQQRHTGMLAASHDLLIFLNDDHYVPVAGLKELEHLWPTIPAAGFSHCVIVDGEKKELPKHGLNQALPYIPGHAGVYRRKVIEEVPWSKVQGIIGKTDVDHSELLRQAGYAFSRRLENVEVYDIELGDFPDE